MNLQKLKENNIVDDDHTWGYQIRLVNEAEYCGKLLVLENGEKGSYHFHHFKKETFIVLEGVVRVYKENTPKGWADFCVGEQVTFLPNRAHCIQAVCHSNKQRNDDGLCPAIILEVSTHDDDHDTYLIPFLSPQIGGK